MSVDLGRLIFLMNGRLVAGTGEKGAIAGAIMDTYQASNQMIIFSREKEQFEGIPEDTAEASGTPN